jgi:3-deoxy-D-manno-octulosonate 8-phosphate phosphatase (KDO 8-P phosphatase)
VTSQLRARARKIKLLLMDVDGVLTDGRIYYLPRSGGGFFETKTFHARDGFGLRLAHQAGLETGIISGRSSPVVEYRVKELGIRYAEQGALQKLGPYHDILRQAGLRDDQVAYVGDDIVDLPLLRRVGLAVGVSSGHPSLRRYVHYWTRQPGGHGAVQEVIEVILSALGKWDAILKRFLG